MIALFAPAGAEAADTIRLAVQKTGTVAWEIAAMKALGLDKAENLDIQTTELATTESGKIALQGGEADLIVSDWLWVARERSLGDRLMFTPYSTALGAIMTPKDSPIHALADLAGRSLGVAGGPLDKSWLMVQAAALQGGKDLAKAARPAYGAPPLIAEKLMSGELDAALEFWTFSVGLEARGFRRAIDMADVEKALGRERPGGDDRLRLHRSLCERPRRRAPAFPDRRGQGARGAGERAVAMGAHQGAHASDRRRRARHLPRALRRGRAKTLGRRRG